MRERILLAGVSTRAMASSAIRAGHPVHAVESFRDLDHPALPAVTALRRDLGQGYSARRAAEVSRTMTVAAVAYAASFENDPEAVALLATDRMLWGNGPDTLRQVRNPFALERALRAGGFVTAKVRASASTIGTNSRWLLKPRRSGGGQRIRSWTGLRPVPRWGYLQQGIEGLPGSLLFVSDGAEVVPIALTRQLIGDHRFGAGGFRYTGNLISPAAVPMFPREPALLDLATRIARCLAARFRLVGLNGIDFVAQNGIPIVTEVNPRWTGAAEVAERAYDVPLFEWHREGCSGRLPNFSLAEARRSGTVAGKAIAYARSPIVVGDSRSLLDQQWAADIPHPGEHIEAGQPICTLFATGADRASTLRSLLATQQRILRLTRPAAARVA